MANFRLRRDAAAVAVRGMPMSLRSPAEGTNSLTRYAKQWDTIWRLDLKDERHALAPPVRLLSGRGFVWRPSYSPDGKKIVFESDRMGYAIFGCATVMDPIALS